MARGLMRVRRETKLEIRQDLTNRFQMGFLRLCLMGWIIVFEVYIQSIERQVYDPGARACSLQAIWFRYDRLASLIARKQEIAKKLFRAAKLRHSPS